MDFQEAFDSAFASVKKYVDAKFDRIDGRLANLDARQGLDEIQAEYDGERRLSLKFVMGSKVKAVELVLPIPIDRGVYNEDQAYERGDTVSSGGSLWICQHKSIGQKPGTSGAFRLAAKKGKDGRDDGRAG